MGWRPDLAPFRPALQLLEPDELEDEWRLRLVLQDKQDSTLLTPIRLHVDGTASGAWASEWSPYVVERAPGWVTRLLEALPRMADDGELLAHPMSDDSAWTFLTKDSRILLEDGWNVMLPAWWEAAAKRKPRLQREGRCRSWWWCWWRRKASRLFGMNSLVNFDWRIAIGDSELSEAEFNSSA